MWNISKAVCGGKFTTLNAYIRKEELFQINVLSFHLKRLGKEDQIKVKGSRIKEVERSD